MFGHSLLYLSLAGLAGLTMAVQGSINSVLGKKIGILQASLVVHILATVLLFFLLLITRSKNTFSLWREIPWYLYLGGLLGVVISYTVIISIPKLGVAVATTAIITVQVLAAALIDHLGLFGLEEVSFSWLKLLGIFFLAVGVRLLLNQ